MEEDAEQREHSVREVFNGPRWIVRSMSAWRLMPHDRPPQSVVRLLAEMIEPYQGRVYDPCCCSGGMFVRSGKFALAHGGGQGVHRATGRRATRLWGDSAT